MSSDASASTDSNTYYEDDFSSTEEDSSQGRVSLFCLPGDQLQSATGSFRVVPLVSYLPFSFSCLAWILILCVLNSDMLLKSKLSC